MSESQLLPAAVEEFLRTAQSIEFWKLMIREYTYPPLAGMFLVATAACVLAFYQLGRRWHWWPLAGMFLCMSVVMAVSALITGIDPVVPRQRIEHFAVFSWALMLVFLVWFLALMWHRLWTEGGKEGK